MIDGKFDVVFRGQTVKNFAVDQVKANLAKLFKSSPEAIERLFSGSEVVIRKDLDYTAAMKYQSALKSSGALALIKEVEAASEQSVAAPSSPQPAEPTNVTSPTESAPQPTPATEQEEGALSMAKAGERILPPKEPEKREVDTSSLSLAGVGERILPPSQQEDVPQPSLDHLSLEDPK
ncbi:hypothetical protein ACUR5C_09270 [Aliikangiella sp. IMCC44653]